MYIIAERVMISRVGDFTCPLKTDAIFVHNCEISGSQYESLESLKSMMNCTTIPQIES